LETSSETVKFIFVLVFVAVIAALYVLMKGMEAGIDNKARLFLHCVMIVTSVIPPELPMELSLAVL
jgi:manganese-transporting P-type ATPase